MENSKFFKSLVNSLRSRPEDYSIIEDSGISIVDYIVSTSNHYTNVISSGVTIQKPGILALKGSYLDLFGPRENNACILSQDDSKDLVIVKGDSLPFNVRLFILLRERIGRDLEDYLMLRSRSSTPTELDWAGYPKSLLPDNVKENKIVTEISSVLAELDRDDLGGLASIVLRIQGLIDITRRVILCSLSTDEYLLVKNLIYSTCVYSSRSRHIVDLANPARGLFPRDFRIHVIDKALNNDSTLEPMLISNVLDTIALRVISSLAVDILKFEFEEGSNDGDV